MKQEYLFLYSIYIYPTYVYTLCLKWDFVDAARSEKLLLSVRTNQAQIFMKKFMAED